MFDVNQVLSENLLSFVPFIAVQTAPDGLDVCPRWVLEIAMEYKFVLQWVEYESNIAVIKKSKILHHWVVLFIVVSKYAFALRAEHGGYGMSVLFRANTVNSEFTPLILEIFSIM